MNRLLLALTLLVVLAGCGGTGGPATDGPETEVRTDTGPPDATTGTVPPTAATATDGPVTTDAPDAAEAPVVVSGGDLTVDANVTYRRVQSMLGIETDRNPVVVVRDAEDLQTGESAQPWGPFAASLGITGDGGSYDGVAGITRGSRVYLYVSEDDTAAEIERTLAHEFAHVLLGRPAGNASRSVPSTTDTRLASGSMLEGAATYVATEYVDEYLPSVANETIVVRRAYRAADPAGKLVMARYLFGARYVDARVDSPRALPAAYDRPPRTTAQVLHPDRNVSYRSAPNVSVVDAESWYRAGSDTRGELFVRVALGTVLDRSAAASAAAGWDGDRLVTFERADGDDRGYVWTLYWESQSEADEFETGVERYVDARRSVAEAPTFRVERTSNRSVTLLVGSESFVDGTSVRVTGRTASVDTTGSEV